MNSSINPSAVCVVTGATGMLGRATAIDLATRGAHVTLISRDPSRGARVLEEVRTAGPVGEHRLIVGTLSEPNSVRAIATQIRDGLDEIHALIHAAAIFTRRRGCGRSAPG